MNYTPILCVVARKHWPLAGYASHATPAMGDDHVAAQFIATARDEKALRGLCEAVFPSTDDGLRGVRNRFPSIPCDAIGYFYGCEITTEVES